MDLGEAEIMENITTEQRDKMKVAMQKWGLELMDDKKSMLIEKIKSVIIELIHYSDELPVIKYSSYISSKLKTNYTYLSKIFSKAKNVTIEHFIILHKIERVKQLLLYNELTLSEIAWKLHYSSTAHLSAQFKKVTGLTPSRFRKLQFKKFAPFENL